MKMQVSLNDSLANRIDKFAKQNYLTRSGLITQACSTYLNQNEMAIAVKDLSIAMNKIADKGEIDSETREQLDDFMRLVDFITSNK